MLFLYERFFVRNVALNLAVNAFDSGGKSGDATSLGRGLKLTMQATGQDVVNAVKSDRVSKVVVAWRNCVGRDEKLVLGSA